MPNVYFPEVEAVRYQGPDASEALAFRHYDPQRVVAGKPMAEQLRPAVCFWHTFCWEGSDAFGNDLFDRPWNGPAATPREQALRKLDASFEFFRKLGLPFFCFHDRDVSPEGAAFGESQDLFASLVDEIGSRMEETGIGLLWGTANLFSHPRYAAGAATNPDPEVFACAAAQVKQALEATHRLGGANYVLWGGREGYDTLLNTDLGREGEQLGRFLHLVAEHKHAIGFPGRLLIEPKPCEPTQHQYDSDAAAVHAFLRAHGLEGEFMLNIEVNHATLAGHSFQHEIAYAAAHGLLGSVDANRGDPQNGWDTDQFPNSVEEMSLALYEILRAGGLGPGGFNFDAKLRRQSLDTVDLFHAHVGGLDTLAESLLVAERMLEDGGLQRFVEHRYRGWDGELGRSILGGEMSLAKLEARVRAEQLDPAPRSGRQEMLENHVARLR